MSFEIGAGNRLAVLSDQGKIIEFLGLGQINAGNLQRRLGWRVKPALSQPKTGAQGYRGYQGQPECFQA